MKTRKPLGTEQNEQEVFMEETFNVTESILRLVRVMRRRPMAPGHHSHGVGKLLRVIAANPGATSRELAEMMDIRPSSLTELLNRLEERGIVVRARDENDLRVVRVAITELGQAEIKHHDEAKRQSIDSIADCLNPEEQKVFCELCDRLAANAERQTNEQQAQGVESPDHCEPSPGGHRRVWRPRSSPPRARSVS